MAVSFKNENSFNFLPHLMISLIFYGRPTPLKSVTMATRNALFPNSEFQKFTNTYLGEVTKFQLYCISRLGASFKKPEEGQHLPPGLIRVKGRGEGLWNFGKNISTL